MQGEQIEEAALTQRGVAGDRGYAVADRATGHLASAKNPRKWAKLIQCSAAYQWEPEEGTPLPPVWITLPNGTRMGSDDPDLDMVLSDFLGRPVTLIHQLSGKPTLESDRTILDSPDGTPAIHTVQIARGAPSGTFFDFGPLHFVTTATLSRIRELHPEGEIDTRRFRPNLVLEIDGVPADFIENRWVGSAIALGEKVKTHVVAPCPRCAVTTVAQGDLPADPDVLRTLARNSSVARAGADPGDVVRAVAGAYAEVRCAGRLRLKDAVQVQSLE